MEIINLNDIDFLNVRNLYIKYNAESQLYKDGDKLYKIFKNGIDLAEKEAKIDILGNFDKTPHLILPDAKIRTSTEFAGYRMPYMQEYSPLSEIDRSTISIGEYLKLIYEISKEMEVLHNMNEISALGDINFDNILYNSELDFQFCDVDGFQIGEIPAGHMPRVLGDYYDIHRMWACEISADSDKVALFLGMIFNLYKTKVSDMSPEQLKVLSKRYKTFKNFYEYMKTLDDAQVSLPQLPYLHEIINKDDFDESKSVKRVLKKQ